MSDLEKDKKKRLENPKGEKGDVLERVMGSIEMAGASLDFFEGASDEAETIEALGSQEVLEEVQEGEAEELEVQSLTESEVAMEDERVLEDEDRETQTAETEDESGADLEDAENLDMLAEASEELEFVEQSQALSIIESLLFSSDRPLGLGTFKQVFKGTQFKTKDIKKALEEMQSVYADPSRGVTLEEINGGWQLRTKVDNMDFLRKLAKAKPFKLSGPALEVLAIIAYKQPIVKSEVDQIRGVESGHLVRALMEKHLVCFQGKSELPGKPMQYGTTRKFLEIFGLRNLRELPSLDEIDQLLPDGIGLEEDDEKLSDVTEAMSENYEGNYSEGEEELLKIEGTLEGIDTSSEFFEEEKRRQKEKRDRDRARDIREALDVGEEVDSKDQKWLARYDEKQAELAAQQSEAQESEAVEVEGETEFIGAEPETDSLIAEPESLTQEFSQMMQENLVAPEVMAADAQMESDDEATLAELSEASEEQTEGETFDPFQEDFEDSEDERSLDSEDS